MIRIGLTGGIGSGKTSVAKWFAQKGVLVFDADQAVHQLYDEQDGKLLPAIREAFGATCTTNGRIDRSILGQVVFNDLEARKKLEALVHPLVLEEIQRQCREAEANNEMLIILEIPLLMENEYDQYVDEVWVVYVPIETQIDRLMQRNNLTREEAMKRIDSQMPLAEKKKKAHRVIDNARSWSETEQQLEIIWKEYSAKLGKPDKRTKQ